MRGDALCAKSDLEGAVRDYTEAIRLLSYADSQDSARLAKDDEEAANEFESADLARIRSYVFYRRGDARRAKDDREGAAQDFAEATRLTNYALGYYCHNRGLDFRRDENVSKATRYLGEAVRLGYRPKNSGSH
jgi:predicted negative regulator of RcsB-dependent stress response